MYEKYDSAACRLEQTMISQAASASHIENMWQCVRKLRKDFSVKGIDYSAKAAAEWLEEIRAVTCHGYFKNIRYVQYRIALIADPENAEYALFYKDLATEYDMLPLDLRKLVDDFLEETAHRIKYNALYKTTVSRFLTDLIEEGKDISAIDCSLLAGLRSCTKQERGMTAFLDFLYRRGLIGRYTAASYNFLYSARIPFPGKRDREYLVGKGKHHTMNDFSRFHDSIVESHRTDRFARTIIKEVNGSLTEFGIFLEANNIRYSEEAAEWYINHLKRSRKHPSADIRAIRIMNDFFAGMNWNDIRPAYPSQNTRQYPGWFAPYAEMYRLQRILSHIGESALNMDRAVLTLFAQYLESEGCLSLKDITRNHIHEFYARDTNHRTPNAKNRYTSCLRCFLKFLYDEGLMPDNLSLCLPTCHGKRVRPVEVLTDEQYEKLLRYCDSKEEHGDYLAPAVLKTAIYTGLRLSDIRKLTVSDIDWERMEFSIMQQKTRRHLRIPFPAEVGNLIISYVTENRPQTENRNELFLQSRAPFRILGKYTACRFLAEATGGEISGFHILRRTFATRLMRNGVSVSHISDALGHSSDSTVSSYISTDDSMMKRCAMPLSVIPYTGDRL